MNILVKKYILIINLISLFVIQGLSALYAQNKQDINTLFISMPDSLSPLLTKVNRQDFSDFLSSNMKAEVKNRFGGTSEMLKLTDNYLKIKTSSVSFEEMKLLPLNDSVNIVCVVKTYLAPVADSSVKFYTTDWKELNADNYISLPSKDEFYKHTAASDSVMQILSKADMLLLKGELSDSLNTISFSFTTPRYLDKESSDMIKGFIKEKPLVYGWTQNGSGFKYKILEK